MTKSNIDIITDNLMTIHPLVYKNILKPIRKNTSITPGGMYVLGSLKRNGILSMSDIGKCLSMPKPHVTVIVDRLIEEEFVERQNDPKDRRIINIILTEKGRSFFEEIKESISENLKEKLRMLSEEDQEIMSFFSTKMKEILTAISENN